VSTSKHTRKCSRLYLLTLAALAVMGSSTAQAAPDIDIYGSIDLYLNHMRSSSGTNVTSMEDGAMLRSRVGIKGGQDLTGTNDFFDYISFQWEKGLRSDNGTGAGNGFDRQSWIGLGSKDWGELRFGRQGTVPFKRGSYIDGSGRTLGSMVNNFGVPSRYNNTTAYISPRLSNGLLFEVQYSLADDGAVANQVIYSAGVDWESGPIRVGYAGLVAKPDDSISTANAKNVAYHNLYGNYDYGQGKWYVVFVRSNNSDGAGGSILGPVGGTYNAPGNSEINNWHHVYQVAVDYKLSDKVTVGGIVGLIKDQSDAATDSDATGGSIFYYYDATEKTRFFAIAEILENQKNASFQHASSGGFTGSFHNAANYAGHSVKGIQLGLRYKF